MSSTLIRITTCIALSLFVTMGSFAQNKHSISHAQAKILESSSSIITTPLIAELEDISSNRVTSSLDFAIGMYKDAATQIVPFLTEYKQFALTKYCMENGYDVIINPLFYISTNQSGDIMTVTFIGFPGKYKNIRQAKEEDLWMLNFTEGVPAGITLQGIKN